MKKALAVLWFVLGTTYLNAQQHEPIHGNSISLEYSYVPGIFIYRAFIPDNLEYTMRISKKIYLQGGVFAQNADEVPGETFFKTGFAIYTGGTMKFYLFKNAYFTPALNLYYDHYSDDILYTESITIGPTVAFEYFFSERFSLRLDAVNINIGIGFPNTDFIATVHRFIGIGARYNFNFK